MINNDVTKDTGTIADGSPRLVMTCCALWKHLTLALCLPLTKQQFLWEAVNWGLFFLFFLFLYFFSPTVIQTEFVLSESFHKTVAMLNNHEQLSLIVVDRLQNTQTVFHVHKSFANVVRTNQTVSCQLAECLSLMKDSSGWFWALPTKPRCQFLMTREWDSTSYEMTFKSRFNSTVS